MILRILANPGDRTGGHHDSQPLVVVPQSLENTSKLVASPLSVTTVTDGAIVRHPGRQLLSICLGADALCVFLVVWEEVAG